MSDLTDTDFPPLEPQPFVTEEGREIDRLRAELSKKFEELAAAIKERDEARRWFCFEARRASDGKNSETYAKQIADMFFWDCFAKEGGGA